MLPTLSVPTLVLHRVGNRFTELGAGRYLAEHIPGTKYVELQGDDHLFYVGDSDVLADEVEEFLTGRHQAPEGDVVSYRHELEDAIVRFLPSLRYTTNSNSGSPRRRRPVQPS